jgi:hypothetical protein
MNKPEIITPQPTIEDIQRLRRLSEEAHARIMEIALIMKHVAGMTYCAGQPATLKSANPRATTRDARDGDWIEIIDVDGVEACYGSIGGMPFAESPCGAVTMQM